MERALPLETQEIELSAAEKMAMRTVFGELTYGTLAPSIVKLMEQSGAESGTVQFSKAQGEFVWNTIRGTGRLLLFHAEEPIHSAKLLIEPLADNLGAVFRENRLTAHGDSDLSGNFFPSRNNFF